MSATKKKAEPKSKAKRTQGTIISEAMMLGERVRKHMMKHGLSDPWSAMNAGGICGICKEKV